MKKQKRPLLVLLIVLGVFVAGYFGIQKYVDFMEQKKAAQEELEKIYLNDLEADDIERITYIYNEESYSFVKEGEVWVSSEDKTLPIIQTKLENMAGKLAATEAETKIENVTDLSQYGLETPVRTITYMANGVEQTWNVGDYNSLSYVYYISDKADSSVVYTVSSSFLTGFNYSLEELIEVEETTETIETENTETEATVTTE